jgi:holo-ACP synthase CitX
MARSLTLSDKSANKLLAARDQRQDALAQTLSKGFQATVFLALNIPGPEKKPAGTHGLFLWSFEAIRDSFPELVILDQGSDALGDFAIMGVDCAATEVKMRCMALESLNPSARLVDLDVYAQNGQQIDRKLLGFAARQCLLCPETAVECMRSKRHLPDQVISKVHELLARFRT